ncbi:ABC transporter ATP-binding protein [Aquibium sp. A9E412]|uniref:ABC transporter ATP-binding protein n=1 Tax=Aquibium sp. A9E412 TaxID=2976767 RepID=UPI0025AF34D5|nr:ABC transporter ATP-binding protein [Aquibium sp. A9E412]MDN2566946.1 ABC transporter ATP-binding protein [Aquibium sp. A9E412]
MHDGRRKQDATGVRIDGVSKAFGSRAVLRDCSLDIEAGTFVTLLGASGSGKTTLLRIIAGFLSADRGDILFDGRSMRGVPTHRRRLGMMFQSYALFPHMSVFDNVAYALRMRGDTDRLAARVGEALELVRLEGYAQQRPDRLSGGQRQRVAMARAVVANPPLLLLDEPLSALDKELREQLQVEIKTIHRSAGTTFINVTHDQGEALGMSDSVVVMGNGVIQQAASPQELWNRPVSAFVARFLGGSNLLRAERRGAEARLADGTVMKVHGPAPDGPVELAVRPELVTIGEGADDGANAVPATVRETIFLGEAIKIVADVAGHTLEARVPVARAEAARPGARLVLRWRPEDTLALPAEAGGKDGAA